MNDDQQNEVRQNDAFREENDVVPALCSAPLGVFGMREGS